MDLAARRSALETARRRRLRSLGVSDAALKASVLKALEPKPAESVRVMQWNLLADGLSDDGFLVRDVLKDWPAGVGHVPTSDGEVVKFDALLTQMMAARGDNEELEKLKTRYTVPEAERNAEVTVDWHARELQIQLQVLAAGRPDFLVFQELDHYGSLSKGLEDLGYSSSMPSATAREYEPAHISGLNSHAKAGEIESAEFKQAIEARGHTFLPNIGSAAMNLKLNKNANQDKVIEAAKKLGLDGKILEGGDQDSVWINRRSFCGFATGPLLDAADIDRRSIDDDGVAIFWRKDKFTPVEMQVRLFPLGNGGALQVKFQETSCAARQIIIIGVHLSSGDDLKSEERRLTEQVDVKNGGLREIVEQARETGLPVVVSMDANSHPQIGADSGVSVWRSLHGALGASVWDGYFDAAGNLLVEGPPDPPVTSNKLRGPLSLQSKKIGLHSYYLIDHVFFTPSELSLEGHAMKPMQFSSDSKAREVLNPSLSCPSDHYPVVVDLNWQIRGSAAQLKVRFGKHVSMYVREATEMLNGTEDKPPVHDIYISALGGAISTAAEVANSLVRDGLVTMERIQTDYQDMRDPCQRRNNNNGFKPQITIKVRSAKI